MADDAPIHNPALLAAAKGRSAPKPIHRDVPVDLLKPGLYQARRAFDPEYLEGLAESIRQHGVIQPLVVRPAPGFDDVFEILAGERRWRAAMRAGLEVVPCYVRADLSEEQAFAVGLIENIQRASLTPIEEAEGLQRFISTLSEAGGGAAVSNEHVAGILGKSRPYVSNALRLLKLPPNVQQMIHEGHLTAGHGKVLVSYPRALVQELVQDCIVKRWSVRQLEAEINRLQRPPAPVGRVTADTQRLASDLADRLGCGVQIADAGGAGTVTLQYFSLDELEGLLAHLMPGRKAKEAGSGASDENADLGGSS